MFIPAFEWWSLLRTLIISLCYYAPSNLKKVCILFKQKWNKFEKFLLPHIKLCLGTYVVRPHCNVRRLSMFITVRQKSTNDIGDFLGTIRFEMSCIKIISNRGLCRALNCTVNGSLHALVLGRDVEPVHLFSGISVLVLK